MADQPQRGTTRHRRIRRAAVAAAVLASGVALVTVAGVVRKHPVGSVERGVPSVVVGLAVGGVVAAVGALWAAQAQHPHAAIGLAVVTSALLLPVWAGFAWLPAAVRAGVLAVPPLAVGGAAVVAQGWPSSSGRSAATRTVWALATVAALVHLLAYDPFGDPSCTRTCVGVEPIAEDFVDTRQALAITSVLTTAAAIVAAAAVVHQMARMPQLIAGAVLATLALLAAATALRWSTWGDRSPPHGPIVAVPAAALAVLGAAILTVTIRTRRVRFALERVVAGLSESGRLPHLPGEIRAVQFADPVTGRWVDADGVEVTGTAGAAHTIEVNGESGPVCRLLVGPGVEGTDAIAALTPATRLSLRNAQLAAVTEARLAEVQASQRRIVTASDDERRRIERDLHDGAQQRLVSAALYLGVARNRLPPGTNTLDRAEPMVVEALANLRTLAHGVFPSALATDGLAVALDDLVATAEVPTTLTVDEPEAIPTEAAMAAYAATVAALNAAGRAGATAAHVSVVGQGGQLEVRVECDLDSAAGAVDLGELVDVVDRVGAVGGRLTTSCDDGRLIVTAVIPCAS